MSEINGIAKKYDGTRVDYVSIYVWETGRCIAQIIPNELGEWSLKYYKNMNIGVTYVAIGCKPITHGPYELVAPDGIPMDTILHYSFNGDVFDSSDNALHGILSGNTNYVQGRTPGSLALQFNSGIVTTSGKLVVGSDKMTYSFWLSTTQTQLGMIYEMSHDLDATHEGLYLYHQSNVLNSYNRSRQNGDLLNTCNSVFKTDGVWRHYIVQVDRSENIQNAQKIFCDNVLISNMPQGVIVRNDFVDYPLHIGRRLGGSFALSGRMQHFRVYNRILEDAERERLFNE